MRRCTITRCKRCESDLNERERIQKLLSSAIEGEIRDIDLSRIWAAVEPTLEHATPRGLPSLRRLGWAGETPRLAATSSRIGGLLLGRTSIDPIRTATSIRRSGRHPPSAVDAPAAVVVGRRCGARRIGAARVRAGAARHVRPADRRQVQAGLARRRAPGRFERGSRARRIHRRSWPSAPRSSAASAVAIRLASTDLSRPARAANKQVQVESVNFPRSSVAMWSEPATDTTVIWIEDEEQAASGRR